MKLRLKNFQSHKDSTLDFKAFTVLVGHSSSGKSAIIRAIKTLLYNLPSKPFIKNGTKKMEIELTLNDNILTYIRDSGIAYQINGGTVLKAVGRGQLPQIAELGFQPLEIDKKLYYPQVSGQWDSPFLISFSDSEISKILSSLSQAGKIKSAKTSMLKDSYESKSLLSVRQNDREALQTKLVGLGDVEGLNNRLQSLLVSHETVLLEERKKLKAVGFYEKIGLECSEEPVPPIPEDPTKLLKLYGAIKDPIKDVTGVLNDPRPLVALLKVCTPIQATPDLTKLDAAIQLVLKLSKLQKDIKKITFEDPSNLEVELSSLEIEIRSSQDNCPTCGQVLPLQQIANKA